MCGLFILGGVVGVGSAIYAVIEVGGVAPYGERVMFGLAALVLAVIAGAGGVLACNCGSSRPLRHSRCDGCS